METTTFRYDCTGNGPQVINQEVHLIGGTYFFVSKVNRLEGDGIETMIFECTEAGNVLNWAGEYTVYGDVDISETVGRFKAILWRHDLINLSDELKAEADACNERFRQSDGEQTTIVFSLWLLGTTRVRAA